MRYLILTIFVLFSFQAKGEVDGWKDFKFGMSKGEVKDQLIRYQKNNKLRTEEGEYGIIPCGIKEIFEQGLYECVNRRCGKKYWNRCHWYIDSTSSLNMSAIDDRFSF